MAKLKLPEQLKSWKVVSGPTDKNGYPSYKLTRVEFDGSRTNAVLTYVNFENDHYTGDNVDIINEEAQFIKSVSKIRGVSNYLDAVVDNRPAKNNISLYILTADIPSLEDTVRGGQPSENQIVDIGLQLSDALDKLESNNILHGNIKPANVFVTKEGKYVLGGFTAFENNQKDFSYTAPEIFSGGTPDYTTDLYSLGLMMYTMSNDGRLPFESDDVSRQEAIEKRFSKAPVTAPANGSEKLKSVIMIACQPDNANRWKNAGNIKNALSSIKSEIPVQAAPVGAVIAPESTSFESNVFEENAFEEYEQEPVSEQDNQEAAADMAAGIAAGAAAAGAATIAASAPADAPSATEPDVTPSYQEPEIDNRVFDDYELKTKVFSINDAAKPDDKDYGDFFEDEPEDTAKTQAIPTAALAEGQTEEFGGNAFYDEEPSEDAEETKRSKTGIIAMIVAIAAALTALAAFGIFAVSNGWFGGKGDSSAAQTAASTAATESASTPATTAPKATAPATTAPDEQSATAAGDSNAEVYPEYIVGTFYDYAIYVLEEQGFNVDIAERRLSDDYDNGYVISMTPDSSEPLKKGSTISIVVSSGRTDGSQSSDNNDEESQTYDDEQSDDTYDDSNNNVESVNTSTNQTNNKPASANASAGSRNNTSSSYSQFKNNTSYLSQSDVNKMSREELNLALNEIYARRGRIFNDASLSAYFNAQSWYTPKYNEAEFAKNVVFNDYESKNISLIRNRQIEKGYY